MLFSKAWTLRRCRRATRSLSGALAGAVRMAAQTTRPFSLLLKHFQFISIHFNSLFMVFSWRFPSFSRRFPRLFSAFSSFLSSFQPLKRDPRLHGRGGWLLPVRQHLQAPALPERLLSHQPLRHATARSLPIRGATHVFPLLFDFFNSQCGPFFPSSSEFKSLSLYFNLPYSLLFLLSPLPFKLPLHLPFPLQDLNDCPATPLGYSCSLRCQFPFQGAATVANCSEGLGAPPAAERSLRLPAMRCSSGREAQLLPQRHVKERGKKRTWKWKWKLVDFSMRACIEVY